MSDTKSLLSRISAFRERLERTPALLGSLDTSDSTDLVRVGARQSLQPAWVSSTLRQIVGTASTMDAPVPAQLISRARKLLEVAQNLVRQQRLVSDDLFYIRLTLSADEPLVRYHQQTVAATESTLRLAQAMPASADHQSRLCDGIETLLGAVSERLSVTQLTMNLRRKEWGRIERISRLLCDIQARRLVSFASFTEVAEEILDEARHGLPLRIMSLPAEPTARFVAAHAINCAQVLARIVTHDFEFAGQPVVAVATALVMDLGMLSVSPTVLGKTGPLAPEDWNAIEAHPQMGAKLLMEVLPELGPIAEAISMHHERLDGTGYPKAIKGEGISSLARLLAVADAYTAMISDRPHREALDPRNAMTDTLMLAEQGRLDKDLAELFLRLSFHPVGTVVELTDGRVAVVISTHTGRVNLRATTRPVVAVLADAHGVTLPKPEFIDLAGSEYGGVVRALSTKERKRLLGATHPDLC
jgi:response regulator RpfG family c-di-GMP phosphodiesterase